MTYETVWTIESIKDGFEKFREINGRYPTAFEIDDFALLPSSRQIQRRFGGVPNLRKKLGLSIENYTTGDIRSSTACRIGKVGKNCENIIFKLLRDKFDEKFVHIERPVNFDRKNRLDFYVFAKPNNFCVDVFNTDGGIRTFIGNMNTKERKYRNSTVNLNENLYFVYFGDKIDKDRVQLWLSRKTTRHPANWIILDVNEFKVEIERYCPYVVE